MNLRNLKTTDKAFYRLSLGWNWSGVFSWFSWGYVCWQEDHRGEVPFPSQHIMGRFHPHGLSVDVDLDHLVKVISVSFLHCKTTLFPNLSILPSGKKLLCAPTPEGWEYALPTWRQCIYINAVEIICMGDVTILPHLLNKWGFINVFHTVCLFWWSNCSSLEKWLILAQGQEIYTISFEPQGK